MAEKLREQVGYPYEGVFIQRRRTAPPPASRTYAGHSAGIHPEEDTEDNIYPTRPGTSAIRWTTTNGNQVIQQGNRRVVIHKERPPSRRFHWMIFMGMVMFVMVLGWLIFTAAGYWLQMKQEDWKYGVPRTFQDDQYVGHGDSPEHPDHFVAVNSGGVIEVVELNPLFPKYDHVYQITTINDSTIPVTLSFEDTNHDGKLDMPVTIGDSNTYTIILLNNGQQFTK